MGDAIDALIHLILYRAAVWLRRRRFDNLPKYFSMSVVVFLITRF